MALDRRRHGVVRAVDRTGPDDVVVGAKGGEHPVSDRGTVVAPADDEVGAHVPLSPRRAS
ncbi:MAG TPA: hypothetical protein DD664_01445 [Janibacter terrae]|nr:hypothetical protein [Janibacter terrae]